MMARRILFLADFNLRVRTSRGPVMIAYKRGMRILVPEAHAHAAIAARAAEEIGLIDPEAQDARR